jgi:hypothetical protein
MKNNKYNFWYQIVTLIIAGGIAAAAFQFTTTVADERFIAQEVGDIQCQILFNNDEAYIKGENGFPPKTYCIVGNQAIEVLVNTKTNRVYKLENEGDSQ